MSFRTHGAGLFGEIAAGAAVRWLVLGSESAAEAGVFSSGPRVGTLAGFNGGTIEGVVNRMDVRAGDPADGANPDASAMAGGIVGENDGTVRDCANVGAVENANALAASSAAGIAGAGRGTIEASYTAGDVRAATNGAYLTSTLTADGAYDDLVDTASCYLAPNEGVVYEGIALDRDGALSSDDLRAAAVRLNDGRDASTSPWIDGSTATQGYPAPADPSGNAGNAPSDPAELDAEGSSDEASHDSADALAAGAFSRERAVNAGETPVFANWGEVGERIDAGTLQDADGAAVEKPVQDGSGFYQLKTPEDLAWFSYAMRAHNDEAKSYNAKIALPDGQTVLDLTGAAYGGTADAPLAWMPIGNCFGTLYGAAESRFSGTFDGGSCVVEHMRVVGATTGEEATAKGNSVGLFGEIDGATIEGVRLGATCSVESTAFHDSISTGGLVGHSLGSTSIARCSNAGSVTMHPTGAVFMPYAGGLVGAIVYGTSCVMERCSYSGTVSVTDVGTTNARPIAAGIIGGGEIGATVRNCFNTGSIGAPGAYLVAGVGTGLASAENCYSTGTLTGTVHVYPIGNGASSFSAVNSYYLNTIAANETDGSTAKTADEMRTWDFAALLNGGTYIGDGAGTSSTAYTVDANSKNGGYPVFGDLRKQMKSWADVGESIVLNDGAVDGAAAYMPTGAGTEADPYVIGTPEGLAAFSYAVKADKPLGTSSKSARKAYVKIALPDGQDVLDLTGAAYGGTADAPLAWMPIGNSYARQGRFSGTFDGGSYVVEHMRVANHPTMEEAVENGLSAGFFGEVDAATIQDVHLGATCSVESTAYDGVATGGLVGYAFGWVFVTQCSNAGSVTMHPSADLSKPYVSGLVGQAKGGTCAVLQSSNSGTVSVTKLEDTSVMPCASGIVGGLGGGNTIATENCFNTGAVGGSGAYLAAGIGLALASVSNCYNVGSVTGSAATYPVALASSTPTNSYYLDTIAKTEDDGSVSKTVDEMRSWDFAALLNEGLYIGDSAGTTSTMYTTDAAEAADWKNGGYPVFGDLRKQIKTWADVGESIVENDGILDGAAAFMPTGAGTEADPYVISSPENLAAFSYAVKNDKPLGSSSTSAYEAFVKIALPDGQTVLDLTGAAYGGTADAPLAWMPIGNFYGAAGNSQGDRYAFAGTFDGGSCVVEHMRVADRPTEAEAAEQGRNVGFFGKTWYATIKNVHLGATCSVEGTALEDAYAGGLAGSAEAVQFVGCSNAGSVTLHSTSGAPAGAAGLVSDLRRASVVERCSNSGTVSVTESTGMHITSQAAGVVLAASEETTIQDCFNIGSVSAKAVFGVSSDGTFENCYSAGTLTGEHVYPVGFTSSSSMANSYYQDTITGGTADGSVALTATQMKTAAFANKLNATQDATAGRYGANAVWYVDGLSDGSEQANGGYPTFARNVADWNAVAATVAPVSAPASGASYELGTADELAWFASQVNVGSTATALYALTTQDAKLTADIDLTGASHGGTAANPLQWEPVGTKSAWAYAGSFDGSGHEVDGLFARPSSGKQFQGFFGYISNSEIAGLGIGANSSVEAEKAGGGIAAYATGSSFKNCYNRSAVQSSKKNSVVGGIAGRTSGTAVVTSCYNAGAIEGPSKGPLVGLSSSLTITSSFYDTETSGCSDSTAGVSGLTTAQMKAWVAPYMLNERTWVGSTDGTLPATTTWTTDAQKNGASLKNDGYPVFGDLNLEKLTVTLDPTAQASGSAVVSGQFMSGLSAKTLAGPVFLIKAPNNPANGTLVESSRVDEGLSTWGTEHANGEVALVAGSQDILSTAAANTQLGSNLSSLDLHVAAAYNSGSPRTVTLQIMDANSTLPVGYEVTVTIKAVTSKTLDVTLPVETSLALNPDGTLHEGDAAAKASTPSVLKSNNDTPVAGKIERVEPLAPDTPLSAGGQVNAVLNPTDAALSANANPITDADQVRLFVAGSSLDPSLTTLDAALYYDNATGTVPLWFVLPGNSQVSWKWGLDYTGLHMGDEGRFGYAASYTVGLPVPDLQCAAMAGVSFSFTTDNVSVNGS